MGELRLEAAGRLLPRRSVVARRPFGDEAGAVAAVHDELDAPLRTVALEADHDIDDPSQALGEPPHDGVGALAHALRDDGMVRVIHDLHRQPPLPIAARCASVSSAARSHVNVSANRRPAMPSDSTSAGDTAMRDIAAAIASTSPWGTRKPVTPSRTDSRIPGESDATTGVAHAAASRFVIPHPSFG